MSDLTFFARLIFGTAMTSGSVDPQLRIARRSRYGRMCGNAGAVKSRVAVHRSALLSGAARFEKVFLECLRSDVCQEEDDFRRIEVHISGTKHALCIR